MGLGDGQASADQHFAEIFAVYGHDRDRAPIGAGRRQFDVRGFRAEHVCGKILRSLATRPQQLPQGLSAPTDCPPSDPWERAIAQARAEIRDLIEIGDLEHDELTAPWIEQWAADIYRDSLPAE